MLSDFIEEYSQLISEFLSQYGIYAFVISIILNIIVATLGFLPGQPITAANIILFGPFLGFLCSWIGESLGDIVGFILYRRGLKNIEKIKVYIDEHKKLKKVLSQKGHRAGRNILLVRMTPFVPGLAIIVASALSMVSLKIFSIYSSLGKLWGIFLEVLIITAFIEMPFYYSVLISLISLAVVVFIKVTTDKLEKRRELEEIQKTEQTKEL